MFFVQKEEEEKHPEPMICHYWKLACQSWITIFKKIKIKTKLESSKRKKVFIKTSINHTEQDICQKVKHVFI